jgi:hypothetical protein
MGFISIFLCIGLVSAIVGIRRLLRERKGIGKPVPMHATSKRKRRDSVHRVRWTNADELAEMSKLHPGLVVFRLVSEGFSRQRLNAVQAEHDVTLAQLEEAVPWIPRGDKLAIYLPGSGIDSSVEKRLRAILCDREALLLSEFMPPMPGRSDELAREFVAEP